MIGLFFSVLILYMVAGLGGFAIGWRFRAHLAGLTQSALQGDINALRSALSEAQVRRAARGA